CFLWSVGDNASHMPGRRSPTRSAKYGNTEEKCRRRTTQSRPRVIWAAEGIPTFGKKATSGTAPGERPRGGAEPLSDVRSRRRREQRGERRPLARSAAK